MHPAKPLRRLDTLKAAHGTYTLINASMVLLQLISQVAVGAMAYPLPQFGFDGSWIGVMASGGHPLGDTVSDGARGAKEFFRRCLVPCLTQQDIDEVAIAIDSPV